MRISFENPASFSIKKVINNIKIEYVNITEVCQGGPIVGNLKINEKYVSESLDFGGPYILKDYKLFLPVFKRKFFSSGFQLCCIDIRTLKYKIFGPIKNLIFIDSVSDETIKYYEDMDRNIMKLFDMRG